MIIIPYHTHVQLDINKRILFHSGQIGIPASIIIQGKLETGILEFHDLLDAAGKIHHGLFRDFQMNVSGVYMIFSQDVLKAAGQIGTHALNRGQIDIEPADPQFLHVMFLHEQAGLPEYLFPEDIDISVLLRNGNKGSRRNNSPLFIPKPAQHLRCDRPFLPAVIKRLQEDFQPVCFKCPLKVDLDFHFTVNLANRRKLIIRLLNNNALARGIQRNGQCIDDLFLSRTAVLRCRLNKCRRQIKIRPIRFPRSREAAD